MQVVSVEKPRRFTRRMTCSRRARRSFIFVTSSSERTSPKPGMGITRTQGRSKRDTRSGISSSSAPPPRARSQASIEGVADPSTARAPKARARSRATSRAW
ncbi:MAG: hypothetical protein A2506_00800 [Elusimicrobia bacterium RIFOXYD12_FULL_66_9]|nr:MAG: hypothetical protein A2506_00800 [Elusimicrobia bacterium RIFOXYD12_FULL_66_9]